jgi:hypothetical protein
MHLGRFVRTFGLVSGISVAGVAIGCGSGQEGGTAGENQGPAIKAEQKDSRKEAKEERRAEIAAEKRESGFMKKGRGRP